MGGGPESAKEKILVILPTDEPKETLEKLREEYPNIEITYIVSKVGAAAAQLPKGEFDKSPFTGVRLGPLVAQS
jgi:hypothetical protein